MILRLRSRDGLERVEVDDSATVAMLKQVWYKCLHVYTTSCKGSCVVSSTHKTQC